MAANHPAGARSIARRVFATAAQAAEEAINALKKQGVLSSGVGWHVMMAAIGE
ncbi:MAG TPA: hypothetical protein VGP72_09010 [Planctomycetota bacterium]